MRTKLFITALCIFALPILFGKAFATLSITPTSFEYTLTQGDYKEDYLNFINQGASSSNVKISITGVAWEWIFINTPQFTLLPGENKSVKFVLHIPEDVADGDYSSKFQIIEEYDNSSNTYSRDIIIHVQKFMNKVWDNWIELNKGIQFGDYKLYVTDLSPYTSMCVLNVTKGGAQIYTGPVSTQKVNVDEHVGIYVTSSYSGETMKGCWVVVESDLKLIAQPIKEEEIPQEVQGQVIKIIGTLKPGRAIVIETSYNGKLMSGTLLIQTENETFTLDSASGLVTWRIPKNYAGPITFIFYSKGKEVDHKVINIEGAPEEEKPTKHLLRIYCPQEVLPNETITCQAIDFDLGKPVGGVMITLEYPGGVTRPKWTSEASGEVSFSPPSGGWTEGTITVIPKISGYVLYENETTIQVHVPREKILFDVDGEIYQGETFTIKVVDPETYEIIDNYNEDVVAKLNDKTSIIHFRNGVANFTAMENGTLTLIAPKTERFYEKTSSFVVLPPRGGGFPLSFGSIQPIIFFGVIVVILIFIFFMVRRTRKASITWEREEGEYPVKPIGKK